MPSFCRHGRLIQNCTICAKDLAPARPSARPARPARSRSVAPRTAASSGMTTRRLRREADDGFDGELVPGLRSTADARRLAIELAFSEARLAELTTEPPGLYAEVAGGGDADEACWLALLVAYLGPLRGPDAFAGIAVARVPWSSGLAPRLHDAVAGPRTGYDARRAEATFVAYREWAERAHGQREGIVGDDAWEPERRFARTFERLALPGLGRGVRFELLVSLGALGVVPVAPGALALGHDAADPVVLAAKRVLGIGDAINLERRALALAQATGVPLGALDLALYNWSVADEGRATMGARVAAPEGRVAEIAAAMGIPDE